MTRGLSGMTMNNAMLCALLEFDKQHMGEVGKIYPLEASLSDHGYDSVLMCIEYYEDPYVCESKSICEVDVWIEDIQLKARIREN